MFDAICNTTSEAVKLLRSCLLTLKLRLGECCHLHAIIEGLPVAGRIRERTAKDEKRGRQALFAWMGHTNMNAGKHN